MPHVTKEDRIKLQKLYVDIAKYEYPEIGYNFFEEDRVTPEKVDIFCSNFGKWLFTETFSNGDVNEVFINKPIKLGFQDRFSDTINQEEYICDVFYYKRNTIIHSIENKIMMFKEHKTELLQLLNFLNTKCKDYIGYFNFQNHLGERVITGKAKNFAYKVFGFVVRSIRQSFFKRYDNINCFYYVIDKKELKRNDAYKRIINTELRFNNCLIDDFTNPYQVIVYWWKNEEPK